jgi:hypothetical protein
MDWIGPVTDIVKSAGGAGGGWKRLLQLCKTEQPSHLWDALPSPNPTGDVRAAAKWLASQIGRRDVPVRGVYLGLDTINMRDGAGHNLELGVTASCDPFGPDDDWAWNCEWYGESHLIRGLVDLKKEYEREQWKEIFDFADYAIFLGYSGLILGEAFEAIVVPEPLLAIWGFHDGDLFRLGRRTLAGFERICEVL